MTRDGFWKYANACTSEWPSGISATIRWPPPSQGTVVELRHAQAIVQDSVSRRRWALPYAAIVPDSTAAPIHPEPAPPPRARREEFFVGDTVGFTDKHLSERVGTIVRLNSKTASIAVTDSEGHWRVSYGLLRRIVDL